MCTRLAVLCAALLALATDLDAQTIQPRVIINADSQIPVRSAPNPWSGALRTPVARVTPTEGTNCGTCFLITPRCCLTADHVTQTEGTKCPASPDTAKTCSSRAANGGTACTPANCPGPMCECTGPNCQATTCCGDAYQIATKLKVQFDYESPRPPMRSFPGCQTDPNIFSFCAAPATNSGTRCTPSKCPGPGCECVGDGCQAATNCCAPDTFPDPDPMCTEPDAWNVSAVTHLSDCNKLDVAVLRLAQKNGKNAGATYGTVTVKSAVAVGDSVHVIAHPDGRCKEYAHDGDAIIQTVGQPCNPRNGSDGAGAGILTHAADTEGGSSGAPIFADDGKVIGVHHSTKPGNCGPNCGSQITAALALMKISAPECQCTSNAECDDNNSCTDDTCTSVAGAFVCNHAPVANDTECDDGNPCTRDDTCQQGTCVGGAERCHFGCYEVHREPFDGPAVDLLDRLGSVTGVFVQRPERLCAPADKNGEDPDAPEDPDHLEGYRIRHPFTKVTNQRIVNQFGETVVDIVKPDRLLVPTYKSRGQNLPPPAPVPPTLDHFRCYTVRHTPRSAPFRPIAGVVAEDQFGKVTLTLLRPVRLCTPANKNHETPGAEKHPDHLLCYKTALSPFGEEPLFLNNQFGLQNALIDHRREFCVPSLRAVPLRSTTTTVTIPCATTTTTSTSSTTSTSTSTTTSSTL